MSGTVSGCFQTPSQPDLVRSTTRTTRMVTDVPPIGGRQLSASEPEHPSMRMTTSSWAIGSSAAARMLGIRLTSISRTTSHSPAVSDGV
jgi:hypothetical protein